MSPLRDHEPVTISEFNGLWRRGDKDNTPLDHFTDSNNIESIGSSSFGTRNGIGVHQTVAVPLGNVKRVYNYPTEDGNTLIVLVVNIVTGFGEIYHVVDRNTVFGPVLAIATMTDFAFLPYAGRGYISPFTSFVVGELNVEKGIENEFLYVYMGDGTLARKAAGVGPTGTLTIANGIPGNTDPGFHIFGVVFEYNTGYLSPPGELTTFTTIAAQSVSFGNVVSGGVNVAKRHIVATKVIPSYNGNPTGYTFYFIPDGTIENNTDNFKNNVSFFDADLLDDASHLLDNYTEIPAGVSFCLYHNRLCLFTTFNDISIGLVSAVGEPEAINQIDGLIIVPPDGNPITHGEELRDVLYVNKRARTASFVDNGDEPATWPMDIVDYALGCPVHGIATVLDSGSSSVDYLIICTYQGITLFNGRYIEPELSWKVEDLWRSLDRNEFRRIQIVNAPIQKKLYVILPDRRVLVGNYANGFDPKKIRWNPSSFKMGLNTVAIVNIDDIIFGADL